MATVDAIKTLHTSMIDTRLAYEKAYREAGEPVLKTLFAGMVSMRQAHHDELHRVLIEMGEQPNEDGSFMANVHRTVITIRSSIKGIDRDSLSAFASGEQRLVKEYDDALKQDDIFPATTDLLTRQKAAALTKIAEMQALAGH